MVIAAYIEKKERKTGKNISLKPSFIHATTCGMKIITSTIILVVAVASIAWANPTRAQTRFASLVAIPHTDAAFAGRLEELASGSGDDADFFRLKLAEAKLKRDDAEAALKWAGRADAKALKTWKDVVMADAYLAAGQPKKALSLLDPLPPRPRPEMSFGETFYANLYKRAVLTAREAKLSLGERADYESAELAANFPTDGDVAGAVAGMSADQKMVRLHALVFAYKYAPVPNIISPDEIISSKVPHEEKCRALYELGYGLRFASGMAPDAVAAFEGLLSQKCERNLEARALYWIGSLGPAAQMDDEAERALTKLAREFKGNRYQDDGYYLLYKRADRRGDDAGAQEYFRDLMKLPKGDMRDKLAFEMAFPKYMRKDYARAAELLEPLVASEAADETFTQVLYWYARSLEKMGDAKKANKVYERIVTEYPYSFYATLSAERAGIPLAIPALPTLKGETPSGDNGAFALIDELNSDGQHTAAKQVMDLTMNLHPEWEKSHEEFIARTYIESQNYRKALDMAAQHFDSGAYGPVAPQSDPMFAAFFPTAYADAVSGGYRLTGLPRGAIEGIMREESLFQSNVRSHAGATGLMQLMPATAAMVARGGAGGASAGDLTNPVDNVLLGASYLNDMLRKFGEMEYAVMAYNAGPGNVNRFQRALGNLELDEFIENIPINETRGYVKRVMRSQRVYASIGGETGSKKSKSKKYSRRR